MKSFIEINSRYLPTLKTNGLLMLISRDLQTVKKVNYFFLPSQIWIGSTKKEHSILFHWNFRSTFVRFRNEPTYANKYFGNLTDCIVARNWVYREKIKCGLGRVRRGLKSWSFVVRWKALNWFSWLNAFSRYSKIKLTRDNFCIISK